MITTILWDIDDTLLDFEAASRAALKAALEECGVSGKDWFAEYHEISEGLWRGLERGELKQWELQKRRFPLFLEKTGLRGDPEQLEQSYRSGLACQHQRIPGALEILDYLKSRGYRMYAATNGVRRIQKKRMEDAGLDVFFLGVFASEEIGWQKPDIRFFRACEAGIPGFRAEETMMIGDSLTSDMEGGIRAGWQVCWFNPRGRHPEEGMEPCRQIRKLEELKKILQE